MNNNWYDTRYFDLMLDRINNLNNKINYKSNKKSTNQNIYCEKDETTLDELFDEIIKRYGKKDCHKYLQSKL